MYAGIVLWMPLNIISQNCRFDYEKTDKFTGQEMKWNYYFASAEDPSFELDILLVNCEPELWVKTSANAKVNSGALGNELLLNIGEGEVLKLKSYQSLGPSYSYATTYVPTNADLTNVPNSGIYSNYVFKIRLSKEQLNKLEAQPIKDVRIPQLPYCVKDYSTRKLFRKKMMAAFACINSSPCEVKVSQASADKPEPKSGKENQTSLSNGPYSAKHSNGQVSVTGQYNNGKMVGEWKAFSVDGDLTSVKNYNAVGELEGTYEEYQKGVLVSKREYKNGLLNGKSLVYTNGSLKYEDEYKNGMKDGNSKEYNANGKLTLEVSKKAGKRNGKQVSYNNEGIKLRETTYVNDIEEGKCVFYYENLNGTKWKEGLMKSNRQDGTWTEYDVKGKIKRTVVYKEGVEVKQ